MDKQRPYTGSIPSIRRITFAWVMASILLLGGCGGPSVCECQLEAEKENPDREFMTDCEKLYKGKSFEEIEAELKKCQE